MSNLTKNAIKSSFIKLIEERPLNKITIKDIVTDCGINRNSFYYHFQDIPSLIEEIIKEDTDGIIKRYPTVSSIDECLKISVKFVLENKKAIYHIYNSVNRDIFEHYLWDVCEYIVSTYISAAFSEYKVSENDRKIIIRYYKCQIFGQISDWLENGLSEDILAANFRLLALREGMINELFLRSERSNK